MFSESEKINKCVQEDLGKTSHSLMVTGLSELSSCKELNELDGIIMDKKSWQRCAVLFKHFGILDMINQKPLLVLQNISPSRSLKFRDSQQKTISCSFPYKTEDFTFALEKLFSIPAEA